VLSGSFDRFVFCSAAHRVGSLGPFLMARGGHSAFGAGVQ
jgi:hypothetical protein